MNWKQRLNVEHEDNVIISKEVDKYLLAHGFYEHTMSPRFMNSGSYWSSIEGLGARCLRLDTDDPRDKTSTMRIFINPTEVYMEVQTDYRSLDRTYHISIKSEYEDELTIADVDALLERISNQ